MLSVPHADPGGTNGLHPATQPGRKRKGGNLVAEDLPSMRTGPRSWSWLESLAFEVWVWPEVAGASGEPEAALHLGDGGGLGTAAQDFLRAPSCSRPWLALPELLTDILGFCLRGPQTLHPGCALHALLGLESDSRGLPRLFYLATPETNSWCLWVVTGTHKNTRRQQRATVS